MELTTYEASKKYKLSTGYLRLLLGEGRIKGRQARIKENTSVWLLDETSLKAFLGTERKPGRPKKSA